MDGIGSSFPMLAILRKAGVFREDPFVLIDVGCSGGIHPAFREFEGDLIAHGLDPVRDECERLQLAETLAGVTYHAAVVGLAPTHEFMERKIRNANGPNVDPWSRLSTSYAPQADKDRVRDRFRAAKRDYDEHHRKREA